MTAICRCRACGEEWSCSAEDDLDTNALTLTGDQQDCPRCGSEDLDIIGEEYDE